jgi:prolyl oligopeptidase
MHKSTLVAVTVAVLGGCGDPQPAAATQAREQCDDPPPATRRQDLVETIHGTPVADPYRWLEDERSPEVQAWMKDQDRAARAALAALPQRAAIQKRLEELSYFDALGAPRHRKGRYFWTRKHQDKEKTVVYWKQGKAGDARVLFDPNTWSADGSISLGDWTPSWDGKYVAYNVKANNSDEAVLHIVEVATGKELPYTIPGTRYAGYFSWTPDSKSFVYSWAPPPSEAVPLTERAGFIELRQHRLGTDPTRDVVLHAATRDTSKYLSGEVSRDGRWLLASISTGHISNDVFLRDTRAKNAAWAPLIQSKDATYGVTIWKDRLYIHTNEGAPRYRVFVADVRRPARDQWKEIVPESDATLISTEIIGGRLVLTYLRSATGVLEIRTLDGKPVRTVALPGLGSVRGVVGLPDEDTAYVAYTSFAEPSVILETSIARGTVGEWARVTLPFDGAQVETEQVRYPSKDGTEVTMFLVRKKGATASGKNPTLLYGYGGFNVNMTPGFSQVWAVWLEQGGMVAIPNLRGGGEYGEAWHRAGMLLKKQNVFDDYVAAARYLIDQKWTSPEHLAIYGGSNGGLLVGAAMTQAPELFGAVVCAVPLLDMVRYHLSGEGRTWIPEYGSAEDAEQFRALHAYSPYHRVKDGTAYPAMLMLSADHDDRVDPSHARKFTAAIQHASASKAPVLLRIEQAAGHTGADMVKKNVEKSADMLSFLADRLGA